MLLIAILVAVIIFQHIDTANILSIYGKRLPMLSNLLNDEKQIQVKTQGHGCYNYKPGSVSINEDSIKKQYENNNRNNRLDAPNANPLNLTTIFTNV
jgi:hypothetical protein